MIKWIFSSKAVCTLIAVGLIAASVAGCTFTGVKEGDEAKNEGTAPQNGVTVSVDDISGIQDEVIAYAKDYVQQRLADFSDHGGNRPDGSGNYTIISAKITGITFMNTGTAANEHSINMYRLEYRLQPDHPENVALPGGMTMEDGWITEWGSTGQPYMLMLCSWDDSGEDIWQRIGVTNTDVIQVDYGTPEMLDKYGNPYTAAAMELYLDYLEQAEDTARVRYATDELLDQYAAYDEFIQLQDEYSLRILISVSAPVSDFKFSRISFDESSGDINFYEDEVLYSQNELNPEKPLMVWVSFPGIFPQRGISFVDENGEERKFLINMSGEDGSVLLSEY